MKAARCTVVSLVDNEAVETYVGVVLGTMSERERAELASRYSAFYGAEWPEDDEPGREMFFREVLPAESALGLHEVLNQADSGGGGVVRGG
jgi:hypothetical protein